MNIFIIGTGNVAWSLIPALKESGHNIVGVYGRTAQNVTKIAENFRIAPVFELSKITPYADAYFILTADSGIMPMASALKTQKIVIHTSGTTDINVLKRYFKNCGVIYPIQTFSKSVKVDLKNTPLLVEYSDEITAQKILYIAHSLSQDVREMTSAQRRCLHLSAVFACNFTNHIIATSKMLMNENEVDFSLLEPLIKETIRKALTNDPVLCQSGPAVRRDTGILNLHLEMLNSHPTLKKIYSFVSDSIVEFSEKYKNGLDNIEQSNFQ
ncbi:MAG: DUF2520 domain-containing protein [Bacteroidales bacterium]|nr:DUF2520 domain-containing protein [Bacteroidales bacterium]